jgi:hypothetical protein
MPANGFYQVSMQDANQATSLSGSHSPAPTHATQ